MLRILSAGLLVVSSPVAVEASKGSPPIAVMILGTYHMGNPAKDVANVQADDVTRPRRQAELRALADALARWRPTKVLVEFEAPTPFALASYRRFTPAQLATIRNEAWQIGFRLARQLGHEEVFGFDQMADFGFDRVQAWADAHGRAQQLDQKVRSIQSAAAKEGKALGGHSVAEHLLLLNDPVRDRSDQASNYYDLIQFGDDSDPAGAQLNVNWYSRNARMFAKMRLIAKPGDRLLILVGSGHRYWLTHFAENSPGFVSVDPRPFLRRAAKLR